MLARPRQDRDQAGGGPELRARCAFAGAGLATPVLAQPARIEAERGQQTLRVPARTSRQHVEQMLDAQVCVLQLTRLGLEIGKQRADPIERRGIGSVGHGSVLITRR